MRTLGDRLEKFSLGKHFAVYFFASLAVALLLYEQSQLSSRAEVRFDALGLALVQQGVMTALLVGLVLPSFAWTGKRWAYAVVSVVFAGYSGSRMAVAFSSTLGLVPTLEARGVPISDYQDTFYLLSLASAITYILSILLLRSLYGRVGLASSRIESRRLAIDR